MPSSYHRRVDDDDEEEDEYDDDGFVQDDEDEEDDVDSADDSGRNRPGSGRGSGSETSAFDSRVEAIYAEHMTSSRPNSGSTSALKRPQTASRSRPSSADPDSVRVQEVPRFEYNPSTSRPSSAEFTPSHKQHSSNGSLGNGSSAFGNGSFSNGYMNTSETEEFLKEVQRPVEVKKKKKKKKKTDPSTSSAARSPTVKDSSRKSPHPLAASSPFPASSSTSTSSSSQMRGNVSHTFKPDFSSTFITGTVSTHEPAINKSLEYLKKARLKKKAEEQALLIAVDKGRREFEYDCLHKMGEANEMSAILGLGISYRANKLESGELRCHLYDGAQFLREITLEAFMREFRRVKKKMDTVKPSALAQKDVSVSDSVNSSKPASNKVNKKARQEELKQVLLETMQLTNKLKEQLLILERKGGNFSPY